MRPSVFHTIVTLSAPAGHLPLEGKAAIREYHPSNRIVGVTGNLNATSGHRPNKKSGEAALVNLFAPQVPSSRAQPRDLYCTAAICTHAPSLKRHLGASFFAFPSPTIYRSPTCAFGAGRLATQEGALMGRLGASLD